MVAKTKTIVKMESAALDETHNKDIILRGVVSVDSLSNLLLDDYQREAMPLTALSSILKAIEAGQSLPDIELGMRGGSYYESQDTGEFTLRDPIYIIDGQQRVNGALHIAQTKPGVSIRIGATLHFNTTKKWERERFRILNSLRSKVSPNVLLRNMREDSKAVSALHLLSFDKNFVLHDRVSWQQRMLRSELVTALTFAKLTLMLHSHKGRGHSRTNINELVPALDRTLDTIGVTAFRKNMVSFFDLVDECWGIRRVQYREGAAYMRGNFLTVLARLLSDHVDFWKSPDEKVLFVDAPLRRKLAGFPIHDPAVQNLAGSGGKSREMLYMLMRDHINSGKRTKRLTARAGADVIFDGDGEDGGEAVALA
jgi:hypothetical protein